MSHDRRTFLGAAALGALTGSRSPAADTPPADLTVAEAGAALRAGRLTAVELTQACLDRITRHDKHINAFITVTAEAALAAAARLDAEAKAGKWRGPLHGVPIGLKDNIDTKGVKTTAGSPALADRLPDEDADVTRRLLAAGAVLVGKLNMAELALGFESVTSHTGPVVNPYKAGHVAGGSSGGSAAAVAAGMCLAALGTDTGGSIRHPAACCNLVGLKPTFGLVSCRGVVPMCWSLDHVGPITRTAEDADLVLRVIAGHDPADPLSLDAPVGSSELEVKKLRLGRLAGPYFEDLDPEVAAAVEAALKLLADRTAGPAREVKQRTPPGDIMGVEIPAGPGRLVAAKIAKCHPRSRLWLVPDRSLSAVSYAVARRGLDVARNEVRSAFKDVDVLVAPTTPGLPFTIEDALASVAGRPPKRPIGNPGQNLYPFNALGLPAVTVPCGFSRSGLPIGLQLIGAPLREDMVLGLARDFEAATAAEHGSPWHRRRPKLD